MLRKYRERTIWLRVDMIHSYDRERGSSEMSLHTNQPHKFLEAISVQNIVTLLYDMYNHFQLIIEPEWN